MTAVFWVVKLLTTALGESVSDYLVNSYDPYLVVGVGFVVFAVALVLQFSRVRYVPWVYWFAVVMVAVFGTMVADVIHVVLGVPYLVSTVVFATALALVFVIWRRSEGTLSIHSITTRRREAFYWAAVSASFALGTAAGDLVAYSAGLGFLAAGLVFAVLFSLPAVGRISFGLNTVLVFWAAYVVTRPLGASFADWTGKSVGGGGLGWGDGPVSAALGLLIVVLVGYLQATGRDVDRTLEPVR
ncbi:hypothetical protein KIH31_15525 [Paenarthrobacter sp. DKR-5]|uniref:COG4705 family protein n=1 Tax=Paenarthrobacter sp. DKR-5 TaxID=2835535 RepID=UPI001BDC428B|nr:hypothetical protein [Paenarthrobacter sp. DKR-5]MBT1003998.1 hypothetical protein [Paenarthrobacter sp. DKR-5]